jgi:NHL repeat-containing protein/WD40 repeat protein
MGRRRLAVAALALAIGLAATQGALGAAVSDEEELVRVGEEGAGAGELFLPFGVGSDPVSGHLDVVEDGNSRVSEFTPWGDFVKAFGWDVAPGAVNEQQEVRVRATAGQFRLKLGGEETADLEVDASAEEAEAALEGLGAIGAGGVGVTKVPSGTTSGKTPDVYVVAFDGGALAGTNVGQLEPLSGTTPPSGGDPSTVLEVRTRADGHAATTGLEACTTESGCKVGLEGAGAGELRGGRGVAVDGTGNVYVSERNNQRVQKFDAAGRHIATFANSGPGQLGPEGGLGIALCPVGEAVCPSGALFVADSERIARFSLAGGFEASLPEAGKVVEGVAFDPVSEELYATFAAEGGLHKLDSGTGAEIKEPWPLPGSGPVATDSEGDVFVRSIEGGVLEYDSAGKALEPPSCCEEAAFQLLGLGTNGAGDLDVSYFKTGLDSFIGIFGPPPVVFEGPPPVAPEIVSEFATSVQPDGASVVAEINPHFFSDTRYRVQYGTGKCSEGGCTEETPPPGPLLTTHVIEQPLRSAAIALDGLAPGTTYHYRFVAESGGGQSIGEEASFTTPEPLPQHSCPNDSFRGGAAARLADCRAYEMVSPIDKNNGDIRVVGEAELEDQSAPDGEKFTYSSYRAFANPKSAPYTSQYLARRVAGEGWESEAIVPGLAQPPEENPNFSVALIDPYKSFSPDLCRGWYVAATDPLLDPAHAFPDYYNIYRADLCGEEEDEALIPVQPTIAAREFYPEPQGASGDGKAALLRMQVETGGPWQAYYSSGGQLNFLCVLPDGTQVGENCSGGTSGDTGLGLQALNRFANVAGAISADGSKAYWTDSGAKVMGAGKVYLRINPGAEQSTGEECEPEKACTVPVSEQVSGGASRFLAATASGEKALFEVNAGPQAGELYEFRLGEEPLEIAGKVLGVAGASEDLSRIYLVSEEELASGATAEEPNLYLAQEGSFTFIATLSSRDVDPGITGGIPSNTNPTPIYHAPRVTPDGSAIAFISTASLAGYDNTDQESGKADSEVYFYRAGSAGPVCVSCNPGGARPAGRVVGAFFSIGSLPTAASLPMPNSQLHIPRALSADGARLFFNSYDALVPRDSNGKEDVYEWEEASGAAKCEEKGAALYVASAGGCLSLISSGESPEDSEFSDAGSDGRDAFFITNASLLAQDPGLFDVYDARVGGGLPPPQGPPVICQGEGCKPAPFAPESTTPSSSAYEGPEDEAPPHKKKKHKKHKKHHHKKHKQQRRAGR